MRVPSALIYSFVFASAILEHPKGFARADDFKISSHWAGVRKTVTAGDLERITSVRATFNVPYVSGNVGGGTFIGIVLGNDGATTSPSCGATTSVSLSVGVLIHIPEEDPSVKFTPVYQFSSGHLRIAAFHGRDPRRILAGDTLTVSIQSVSRSIVAGSIVNDRQGWSTPLSLRPPLQTWLCLSAAEWKIGRIFSVNNFVRASLPLMSAVTFNQATVTINGAEIIMAGVNSDTKDIERPDGQKVLQAMVSPYAQDLIEFRRRLVS